MKIKELNLINFRNLENFEIKFSSSRTLILGQNGVGKSSILEAIYLLSSGESLRADHEEEIIRFDCDFAKVLAELSDDSESLSLDLTLDKRPERRLTKSAKLNGVKKTLAAFWGIFKVVEFGPADINLVAGPPEARRRYLNSILNQVSLEYRQAFLNYEKARRQKISLLDQINEGISRRMDLKIWNEQLLTYGRIVQQWRQDYLNYLANNLENTGFNYFPSQLSAPRLEEFLEREIAAGSALIGPHRDDFEFTTIDNSQPASSADGLTIDKQKKGLSLAHFGSRGEQRMSVFDLKLGEIKYFREELKVQPILLLDDIFSELDEFHRGSVWAKLMEGTTQVILTATKAESIEPKFLKEVKVVEI